MLRQARMEPGLNAEQGHGVEVCAEEPLGNLWDGRAGTVPQSWPTWPLK